MKIAIIESPCAPSNGYTREEHAAYLDECIRWCVTRGYTPYASHKMMVGPLDDDSTRDRAMGMSAGLSMTRQIVTTLPCVWLFFADHGISTGMEAAWEMAQAIAPVCHAAGRPLVAKVDTLSMYAPQSPAGELERVRGKYPKTLAEAREEFWADAREEELFWSERGRRG